MQTSLMKKISNGVGRASRSVAYMANRVFCAGPSHQETKNRDVETATRVLNLYKLCRGSGEVDRATQTRVANCLIDEIDEILFSARHPWSPDLESLYREYLSLLPKLMELPWKDRDDTDYGGRVDYHLPHCVHDHEGLIRELLRAYGKPSEWC